MAHKFLGAFKAFTLAEVLVTLTILGIVASITVPGIVKRQTERTNKTKILKAMTTYESVLQQIAINEGISSISALKSLAKSSSSIERPAKNANGDDIVQTHVISDCSNLLKYLKVSDNVKVTTGKETARRTSESNCRKIRTSDGLWWDFNSIDKPIVAFKDENLSATIANSTDNNDAFYFIAKWPENSRTPVANTTENLSISNKFELMDTLNNANETSVYGNAKTNEMLNMKKLYSFVGKDFSPGGVKNICTEEKCCEGKTSSCMEMYLDPVWGYYYRSDPWYVDRYGDFNNITAEYQNGQLSQYNAYSKKTGYKIEVDANTKIAKISQNGTEVCYQYEIKDEQTARNYASLMHSLHRTVYSDLTGESFSSSWIKDKVECK